MSEPSLDDVFVHYTGLTIEEAEQKSKFEVKRNETVAGG